MERSDRSGCLNVIRGQRRQACKPSSPSFQASHIGGRASRSVAGIIAAALLVAWIINAVWPYLVVAAVLVVIGMVVRTSRPS